MTIKDSEETLSLDQLQVKRLDPMAQLPTRATGASVGYDLYAFIKTGSGSRSYIAIPPKMTRRVDTRLVILSPPGHMLLCCSRSGLASKSVFVTNSPGVIDPDYTGEISVLLYNGAHEQFFIRHGDRIAQLLVVPYSTPPIVEIETLPITERGDRGFGSTGA